jgi:RNA polymerase sigma-70 factor (ECF subfamily)
MDEKTYMENVLAMQRSFYRVARSVLNNDADAADAVQETVMKGWLARRSLRKTDALKAWLMRILVNECRNIQRREGRRRDAERRLAEEPGKAYAGGNVDDALAALPEKYRLIVTLHYLDGYGYAEIARITGMAEGLVKSRLYQARRALGNILEE